MFCENIVKLVVIIIFSQLLRSQFLIDQKKKKMLSLKHFHINFTINHKLAIIDG